jgi:hypothetical protein
LKAIRSVVEQIPWEGMAAAFSWVHSFFKPAGNKRKIKARQA